MVRIPDRHLWLPELTQALSALAVALGDKDLTPEIITTVCAQLIDVVPNHKLEIHWLEHGYMYEPEYGDEPSEPEYALTINGDRLKAGWIIMATDLPKVLALALPTTH